jgi:hypothetical protein
MTIYIGTSTSTQAKRRLKLHSRNKALKYMQKTANYNRRFKQYDYSFIAFQISFYMRKLALLSVILARTDAEVTIPVSYFGAPVFETEVSKHD